jgi:hypothetical protein
MRQRLGLAEEINWRVKLLKRHRCSPSTPTGFIATSSQLI